MDTLLKKAKAFGRAYTRRESIITKQDINLALAWARGEVGIRQVAHAYGIKNYTGSHVYIKLARALRDHITTVDNKA